MAVFFLCTFVCFFAGAYVGSSDLFSRRRKKMAGYQAQAAYTGGPGASCNAPKSEEDLRVLAEMFARQQAHLRDQQQQQQQQQRHLYEGEGRPRARKQQQQQHERRHRHEGGVAFPATFARKQHCSPPVTEDDESSVSFTQSDLERHVAHATMLARGKRFSPKKRSKGNREPAGGPQYVLPDDSQDLAAVLAFMEHLGGSGNC